MIFQLIKDSVFFAESEASEIVHEGSPFYPTMRENGLTQEINEECASQEAII
jgi:hypothetical protein